MNILGISFSGHDSGAALIKDGKVISVINEERISRIKEDGSFPSEAIRKVLKIGKITEKDIDIISVAADPFWIKRLFACVRTYFQIKTISKIRGITHVWNGFKEMLKAWKTLRDFKKSGFKGKIEYIPHYMCHLYTAYVFSCFTKCLVFDIEGISYEDVSTAVGIASDNKIQVLATSANRHSPGRFYSIGTSLLGFRGRLDAGKITGLAAYGDHKHLNNYFHSAIWTNGLEIVRSEQMENLQMEHTQNGKRIPKDLEAYSKEDIAAALQRRLEEVVCELVENAVRKTRIRKVALAGGVSGNVKMNQRVLNLKCVDELYIHPGMSDVGLSLGSAAASSCRQDYRPEPLDTVYLGPEYNEKEILTDLRKYSRQIMYRKADNIEGKIATMLKDGKIIGYFAGKMEYGPRALGNRSILASPRDGRLKKKLNNMLKRTEFMPFAPSVLEEDIDKLFKNYSGSEYSAQFMTITYDCTEEMKEKYKATVHVDNTARPHLVNKQSNPRYHKILQEYKKLSGLSGFVNTSFNMHEDPIVMSPQDAIETFLPAGLDALIIEDFIIEHKK